MIDWDRVDELRKEVGEEDFVEAVGIFLDEVESVLAQIRASDDPAELRAHLHFLKGGAMNLGFRALGAMCVDLGPNVRPAAVAPFDDLATVFDRSKAEFLGRMDI